MSARSRLRRLGRALATPFALVSIGLALLALAVWFLGPLIAVGEVAPLEPLAVRLAILLVLALVWGIAGILLRLRRNSDEEALLAGLKRQRAEAEAEQDRVEAAIAADSQSFRDRLNDALRLIRRSSTQSRWQRRRFPQPWYLVLGADGAGKTTAAARSGLTPVRDLSGHGTGGDILIAEEAVLVEMPGRYLALGEAPQDGPVWLRMLKDLRRLRPLQPINGILVVLDAAPLALASAEEIADGAALLRRRLDEVAASLRTRPPVYLLLSKLDAIAGFEPFFETLNADERAAVLAVPLPALGEDTGAAAAFATGFDALARRLRERKLQRLQEEPDAQRRLRLYEFPAQFATLGAALTPLVAELTAPRRFSTRPLLRGVFFGSALQSGFAADTLGGPMAPVFAQPAGSLALPADADVPRGRSYFLSSLMPGAVLPEASSGGRSRHARLWGSVQRLAAVLLLLALVGSLGGLWLHRSAAGRAEVDAAVLRAEAVRRELVLATASDGTTPVRFAPVLAVLDDLRALQQTAPQPGDFGLWRSPALQRSAEAAYARGLDALLVPFLWRYLEQGLADDDAPPGLTLQQLKLYLMLGGAHAGDSATAAALAADFRRIWLPQDGSDLTAARISRHLEALMQLPQVPRGVDSALVQQARRRITDASLARLAFERLRALPATAALPDWRPAEHMSAAGPRGLARVSGASLFDGIPGLYTRAGFLEVVRPSATAVAEDLAADLWAMGNAQTDAARTSAVQRLTDGTLDLYRAEFIRHWDSLLADLTLRPTASASEAADVLAVLIGPPSPIVELAGAIAAETDLAAAAAALAAAEAKTAATTEAAAKAAVPVPAVPPALAPALKDPLAQLRAQLRAPAPPQRLKDTAQTISDHFQPLRSVAAAGPDGQPPALAALIAALGPLYSQLSQVSVGANALELGRQAETALTQMQEQIGRLPQLLQPLFRRIGTAAGAVTGGVTRDRLSALWSSTVQPVCTAVTRGRYPFDPASAKDASLADFTLLFGPTGAFASFQNDNLAPFLDTGTRPWRWAGGQSIDPGLGDDVLAAFERAADIRAAFFAEGDAPKAAFTAQLLALDPRARAGHLDLGGPVLVFTHGPAEPAPATWSPTEQGDGSTTVSIAPELEGQRNAVRRTGPWALFRILGEAARTDGPTPESADFTFALGSREMTVRLTAQNAANPLTHELLAGFVCPSF